MRRSEPNDAVSNAAALPCHKRSVKMMTTSQTGRRQTNWREPVEAPQVAFLQQGSHGRAEYRFIFSGAERRTCAFSYTKRRQPNRHDRDPSVNRIQLARTVESSRPAEAAAAQVSETCREGGRRRTCGEGATFQVRVDVRAHQPPVGSRKSTAIGLHGRCSQSLDRFPTKCHESVGQAVNVKH